MTSPIFFYRPAQNRIRAGMRVNSEFKSNFELLIFQYSNFRYLIKIE